jgi:hypothetical protein
VRFIGQVPVRNHPQLPARVQHPRGSGDEGAAQAPGSAARPAWKGGFMTMPS